MKRQMWCHYHPFETALATAVRYRDEELELGEVVNFQVPVELDAGRRWLEAGQTLVRGDTCYRLCAAIERSLFRLLR